MSNNPAKTDEWKILSDLSKTPVSLMALFKNDPERFENFSFSLGPLFIDFSKQKINSDILTTLLNLAKNSKIEDKRDGMFAGEKINSTEGRAVLHTALRSPANTIVKVDGKNVIPEIHETLNKIEELSQAIRKHHYLGSTGKAIKDIVSIGIGGSDLGPRMVYKALKRTDQPVKLHFIANIDGDDINDVLQQCDPETTLFIIISKSFGTQETLTNALTARAWAEKVLSKDTSKHFMAVSSNIKAATSFGIDPDNILPMWDWVNGRFSLWSAVGFPLAIGLGFDVFKDLLKGAYEMDQHFKEAPLSENIPVIAALVAIWNRNFLDSSHQAVLPYSQRLCLFASYLQQLEMESNGKSVDNQGHKITDYKTSSVVFGETGTNGQHSFYQLLHQGSETIPCDFIGVTKPNHPYSNHHELLIGHMLAQGQAMMQGKSVPDNLPKDFEGNKPSTTILLDTLNAQALGMLIALYEHKVMVQGSIWNINSFDQFGVELGKEMAKNIEKNDLESLDPSTRALYSRIHK